MLAASTIHPSFSMIDRNGEAVFVHKSKPLWIVGYEAIETPDMTRPARWHVYYTIEPLKRGRQLWAHNNRNLAERGFPSLEAAFAAGEAYDPT